MLYHTKKSAGYAHLILFLAHDWSNSKHFLTKCPIKAVSDKVETVFKIDNPLDETIDKV